MLQRYVLACGLLAATLGVCLPAEARAQEADRGFSLDLFGSYTTAEAGGDTANEESWGLRGSYRFTNVWALEAAVSTLTDDGVDAYFGDFSAKAYLLHSNRFAGYLLAGVGLLRIDEFDEDETTLHLGLGAEIKLGDRAYLRPEVRGRWFEEDIDAVTFMDYSLGIGWRF